MNIAVDFEPGLSWPLDETSNQAMELAGLEPATSWVRSRLTKPLEMADLQVIH
jgi:hypothetical protein